MGLPNLARYFASSFHQICQWRPGQSAWKLPSSSPCDSFSLCSRLLSCEAWAAPVQVPVFLVPARTWMFWSTMESVCLFFFFFLWLCSAIYIEFVCMCVFVPQLSERFAGTAEDIAASDFFCALSSSPFAFLVCWKGSFLFFFPSHPLSVLNIALSSSSPFFEKTLLTF